MSKHLIKGFVYHVHYDFQEPDQFHAAWDKSSDMGKHSPDWVLVGPHDFEIEIPDDFDPRPKKVAALVAKKQELRAEFAKNVCDLDEQINRLLCLENAA